jgi:hypothetical protein
MRSTVNDISDRLVEECTGDMPLVITADKELGLVASGSASARVESLKTHTIACRIINQLPWLKA